MLRYLTQYSCGEDAAGYFIRIRPDNSCSNTSSTERIKDSISAEDLSWAVHSSIGAARWCLGVNIVSLAPDDIRETPSAALARFPKSDMRNIFETGFEAFRSHTAALDGNRSVDDAVISYYVFLKAAQDLGR